MKEAPTPPNEEDRLKALHRYDALECGAEPEIDNLARLAAQICGTPIGAVCLVDDVRQVTIGSHGLPAADVPRNTSFCALAIAAGALTCVPDTAKDPRFKNNPHVTGSPGVRFYAAAPIVTPDGFPIGALNVMDVVPRELAPEHAESLTALAKQVMLEFEMRRAMDELQREVAEHERTEAALIQAESKYRSIFENAGEGIFLTTPDGKYLAANPMLAQIYGYESSDELMRTVHNITDQLYVDPKRREEFRRRLHAEEFIADFESQVYRRDGSIIWISEKARAVHDENGELKYYEGAVEDITRRREQEDLIRRSEMRFRAIWDTTTDGMRLTNRAGDVLSVNKAFCQMVGLEADAMEGRSLSAAYADDGEQEDRVRRHILRFKNREFADREELKLTFQNGKTLDVEISNAIVEMENREQLLLSVFHDITERRRADDKLRESELLYHSLVESLPQNIFRKDLNERFTFANQNFCKLMGKPLEEVLGKTDFDFSPKELAEKYQEDDQRVMAAGKPFQTVEEHCEPGQPTIYVETVKTPLYDRDGNIAGIQGIFWDVTEKKRTENQLNYERDLLRSLLDTIPDRIYFKDRDSHFIRISRALADQFGLDDPEEAIGKSDFDFFTREHAQPAFEDEQKIIETGKPIIGKTEKETWSDGGTTWALTTKMALQNTEGEIIGTFGVSKDITELKQAEEQLALTRDAALESARLKSEFLATMSHEIRTPLNGIIGMTGLLLDTTLNSQQRDFARTVRSSADALLDIINDILDFSKMEAGRLVFEKIDFDLRGVVEDIAELMAERAQSKGIEFGCDVQPDMTTLLRGDSSRIRQVILNLVGNAVKFTTAGEVVIRVSKEAETDEALTARVAVCDTGIGISRNNADRIFEAFTQADGSTTRRYGGTGLGLAICKQLIEMMGGRIGVDSVMGEGSTFWFTLRLDKQVKPHETGHDVASLNERRALIVDDNATNRDIVMHQTLAWGMTAHSANDGSEALQELRRAAANGRPYEIALLDMQMPEMDGIQLAREIKADPAIADTRLAMLTSLSDRFDPEELSEAGFSAALVKPVKQKRLLECIARTLAGEDSIRDLTTVSPGTDFFHRSQLPDSQKRIRILLAEDNSVNQKVALLQLKRLGFGADCVADGAEAVEELKRVPYDVVLMDCHMPIKDGYEATREIRAMERAARADTPDLTPAYIIAMTANAMEGDRDRCLEAGMDDYVAKPVESELLAAAFERARKHIDANSPEPEAPGPAKPQPEPAPEAGPVDAADCIDLSVIDGLRELREPGEPDPVAELIDLYLADSPNRVEQMRAAAAKNDAAALKVAVHTLKGSSSNLGAKPLAKLCAEFEERVTKGNLDDAGERADAIEREFAKLRIILERERER